MAGPGGAKKVEGFVGCDGVGDVAEVDAGDDLLGGHFGEEPPKGFRLGLCVKIPDGVDEGGAGKVNDTFFRTEPTELGVTGDLQVKRVEVRGDGVESSADDVASQVFEGGDDQVSAAAESKG